MCSSTTWAPTLAAASIWAGSASMNSETRMPAAFSVATHGRDGVVMADDVEAALGGHLLAPLRHQAGGVRQVRQRDRLHLRR